MSLHSPISVTRLRAAFSDMQAAQRALFDDFIRLDRAADPADLPHVPLRWRRTFGGWELDGTVLPSEARRRCERPC